MRIDKELMDFGILGEGFQLTHLWDLRERLLELSGLLNGLKGRALNSLQIAEVGNLESRLFYVNRNLEIVNSVMIMKELDIFTTTEYGEICLN